MHNLNPFVVPANISEKVDEIAAHNRLLYAGWTMLADDDADDEKSDDDDAGDDSDGSGDKDSDDEKSDDEDWQAKYEAQQRINRQLERKTRRDLARIKQLEGQKPAAKKAADKGGGTDDAPDLDKIREEAKAEAAREVLHSRVEDKIEAKARAFADPEDAVAVLLRANDIEDFIDDGKIDVDAIADALKELGEKKPHLLAQGGKKFQGDADGGARKESTGRPKSLGDAVAKHYQPRK